MAKKILLIINNPQVQKSFSAFLEELGYSVFSCEDGKESLDIVNSFEPDLILCESSLPVISGNELAELFKSHVRISSIPFILITSKMPTIEEIERAEIKIAADDFIKLPLDQSSVLGMIYKWIESDEKPKSIGERIAGELPAKPISKHVKSWRRGKVNCASLGRLLFHLLKGNDNGTIKFSGKRRKMTVLAKDGKIVDIMSNYIREDTLGLFLTQTHKITTQENKVSLKRAREKGYLQGKALMKMGLLTQRELEHILTQQKKKKFLRLFQGNWAGSLFEFIYEETEMDGFSMRPVELYKIIKMGLFKIAEQDSLYNIFIKNGKTGNKISISNNFENIANLLALEVGTRKKAIALQGQTIDGLKMSIPDQFDDLLRLAFLIIITKAANFSKREAGQKGIPGKRKAGSSKTSIVSGKVAKQIETPFQKWDSQAYHKKLVRAQTLVAREDFEKAIGLLRQVIKINPDSSQALSLLAQAMLSKSPKSDISVNYHAKELLKKAINIDRSNDNAFMYLGIVFKNEGKLILSENHFRKALDINPSNSNAKHELNLLLRRKKRTEIE